MFDLIAGWMEAGGAVAVFALMFLENLFPPIPSELVMPLAGFKAASGNLNVVAVLVSGTAGSVLGALFWYWVGARFGPHRLIHFAEGHGFWLTVGPHDITRALGWFDRHGAAAVFFGRMVPGIRTLISVPAGLTRMPLPRFLLLTTLGSAVWTGFLTFAGYILEAQYHRIETWLNPVTTAIVIGLATLYLCRLALGIRQRVSRRNRGRSTPRERG